jgi:O-antigen/teichoic acid export membrane protein
MAESLKTVTFKNIGFNAIGKVVAFLFQSAATIIVSRELIAEDYGVAGFAMICVTFMRNFSSFGISDAAVHARDFDNKGMNTAFTLRLILSLFAFAITIALSGFAEHMIQHKAITSVIRILAFAILIDNVGSVSSIILERNLKYSIISIAETGLTVTSSITAIILALNGFKYWSIVYGYISANIAFVLIMYLCKPYRFKFALDTDIANQYLRYGAFVFLSGLLYFAIFNVDNFIIGSVAGASQLGYYAIAFNWGGMVATIMWAVAGSVLFPTFSRMQDDPARVKHAYLVIIEYIAMINILCNVGLFCVADNFLFSVLGKGTDKWLPSLQTLRILCIYGVVRSLIAPASPLMMAQGKTRIQFQANLLAALIEFALVYPAIRFGSIEIVGLVVLLSYVCQLFIYLPALKQINNISVREIGSNIWPAIVSGVAMFLCYVVLNGLFTPGLTKLAGSILILTVVYIVTYGILTQWRIYIQLKNLIFASR